MQAQNNPAARDGQMRRVMTRPDKQKVALRHISGKAARGLEIGCNFQPLLRRSEGYNIQYLEATDTEGIRKRAIAANKPLSLVEDIDFVFDADKTLPEMTGVTGGYDYVISSHVIEHIPNLVKHFQEVEAVLKPGGKYIAIIPDKNYCFDVLKPLTTFGRLVDAFVNGVKRPPLSSFIDEMRYSVKVSTVATGGWNDKQIGALSPKYHNGRDRIANAIRSGAAPSDWYGHTWAFTARSFAQLFCDLEDYGLTGLNCVELIPTFNMDFIAVLGKAVPEAQKSDRASLLQSVRDQGYPDRLPYDDVPESMTL